MENADLPQRTQRWNSVLKQKHLDEGAAVDELLRRVKAKPYPAADVSEAAQQVVAASRAQRSRQGTLDAFLNQFGLSNQEGVALMCLAEALLRVPDAPTQDALIAEKILAGKWSEHRGHSEKIFVNAGVWALMLTGRLLDSEQQEAHQLGTRIRKWVARSSESSIRGAVRQAMSIMGGQFVYAESIEKALERRPKKGYVPGLYSFDMLGEGARTPSMASRYFEQYANAIQAVGRRDANSSEPLTRRASVSIKLSALHARYEATQPQRVWDELYPRIRSLILQAAERDVPITLDAEEVDRLETSLEILEQLLQEPKLRGWDGLGLALQAYQLRTPSIIEWLNQLAEDTGHQIPVRLVKGAYWDSEIKHSQEHGHPAYPVFTSKAATDLSYLVCAQMLFDCGESVYPQFATHNAHTMAAVMAMSKGQPFEFQRLHGMGELLYRAAREKAIDPKVPVRVYAPVGEHADLLPYLVRRLLENGANSSFVHRFMNEQLPISDVIADPAELILEQRAHAHDHAHGRIPLPIEMYGDSRDNSKGIDVFGTLSRQALESALERHRRAAAPQASCLVNGLPCGSEATDVFSPVDQQMRVGSVRLATPKELEEAERVARAAQPAWDARGGADRGRILRAMADALEAEPAELLDLISREAGRTIPDAISEVREAVDFLRFYAAQAEAEFEQPQVLPGPTGEANSLSLHGRGVFVCISPWNFPLAIFTGQVAAALAAGNTVLAKPAEQTSLIAHVAVQRFFAAGLPPQVLQLLLGTGAEVAAPLIADGDIDGVAFTGSTATAKRIQLALAQRPGAILPLIAETGGLNAMVVDSTALLERACDDILASAFGSAGQRCSALRMLLIQEDIADDLLGMLSEALQLLRIGKPWELSTDVGPVIDHKACKGIQSHLERMENVARPVAHLNVASSLGSGNFVAPHIIEIKNVAEAPEEVFGPVLHVVRWNLNNVYQHMQDLKGTGYGLTFGVHSRLDRRQDTWARTMGVGNTYINRSMVGAVVGSQPFGGSGLSGTGPKAGGPHYLYRFATERCLSVNTTAIGGNTELFRIAE